MKTLVFYCILFVITTIGFAQTIEWQKTLGGTGSDMAYSIQQTADGGYIIAGTTTSNDNDVSGYNGGVSDGWVVKTNLTGNIVWQKCYGGSGREDIWSIRQTTDGGYVFVGSTTSTNGAFSTNHGYDDYWVVKLDASGNVLAQNCYGGTNVDIAYSVQQTSDKGYIVAGGAKSNNGDVVGNHGTLEKADYWILKSDSNGIVQWKKCYGGSGDDKARCIQQTNDGGYIITGTTSYGDGDVTVFNGFMDYWIVKVNSTGVLQWQKSLGGGDNDIAYYIRQTSDNGYIVIGEASSVDGDVVGIHNPGTGNADIWVIKLDSDGDVVKTKCIGGTDIDVATSIQQTSDGGYLIGGYSNSYNGDITIYYGNYDYWLIKLNPSGEIEWQKCFGGTANDYGRFAIETNDNKYVMVGYSRSNDYNVAQHYGSATKEDIWMIKVNYDLVSLKEINNRDSYFVIYPNPTTDGLININNINNEDVNVRIINSSGQIIFNGELNNNDNLQLIDISSYSKGIYFMELKGKDFVVNKKILKL